MQGRPTALVERTFNSLEEALAAIGGRRNIDYMATINGRKDRQRRYAYNAANLKGMLLDREFDPGRDSISVWLPETVGADMLSAS